MKFSQETANLVTFTEEILNGKPHVLCSVEFLRENLLVPQFYKNLTRKINVFEGCSWSKLNNLGLALDMKLKF